MKLAIIVYPSPAGVVTADPLRRKPLGRNRILEFISRNLAILVRGARPFGFLFLFVLEHFF